MLLVEFVITKIIGDHLNQFEPNRFFLVVVILFCLSGLRIGREYGKKQDERETEEMKSEREFPLIRKLTEASVVSLKWVKSRTHPAAAWLFECSRCIGSNHNDIVCLCMCMRSRVGRLTAGVTAPLC